MGHLQFFVHYKPHPSLDQDRGMSGFHIQITHLNLAAQWMFTHVHPLRWKVKGFDQDREIDATLWYFSHSYGK
jgi:hypothetical protein